MISSPKRNVNITNPVVLLLILNSLIVKVPALKNNAAL